MDWIDDYTIGVPAIDNQHKQLVKKDFIYGVKYISFHWDFCIYKE